MAERITEASTLNGWRKSSRSNIDSASCVEVVDGYAGGVPVRDSKVPGGPALVIPTAGWSSFVTAVKGGTFPL